MAAGDDNHPLIWYIMVIFVLLGSPPEVRRDMGHIFVSYSRRDLSAVDKIVDYLGNNNISVWIDRVGITGGDQWRRQIVDAIDTSDAFLLVLSNSAVVSDNVRKEIDLAEQFGKRIIPVEIELTDIPRELSYQLVGIQRINLIGDVDGMLPNLMTVLSSYRQVGPATQKGLGVAQAAPSSASQPASATPQPRPAAPTPAPARYGQAAPAASAPAPRPSAVSAPPSAEPKRPPWLWIGIAAAVVVVLGIGAILFSGGGGEEPTQEPEQVAVVEPTERPAEQPTEEPTERTEPTAEPTQQLAVPPTQAPTAEPTQELAVPPTQVPEVEPELQSGDSIFFDDFDSLDNWAIWSSADDADIIAYTEEGSLFIGHYGNESTTGADVGEYIETPDVVLVTYAMKVEGPNETWITLYCRNNQGNGYGFGVTQNGRWEIQKFASGESTVLDTANTTVTELEDFNEIVAICYEDTLTLIVNGEEISTVVDDQFSEGGYAGLWVYSAFWDPLVEFLDFGIYVP